MRIYDIFFDYSVLLDTDAFFRQIISGKEFQKSMSTAEFHYLCGRYVHERERKLGKKRSLYLQWRMSTLFPSTLHHREIRQSA